MGLFTNPCINPECGYRVRKGSKFCPKCGIKSSAGLTYCGQCEAEVSTASKFCWKCGVDLASVVPDVVGKDRWARKPGDFAARFDNMDVKGALVHPLIIEHGTRAILFQNGKFCGEIPEGRYDVDGFLSRLSHFFIDQRTSVVIVDAGDVQIDLENAGLWTSDPFEVGTIERIVLRIANPEALFVNLFKGQVRYRLEELETQLSGEVQSLIGGIVAKFRAQDLFNNLEVRTDIEQLLRQNLATTLSRFGLELVQLRFIDFAGETYEKLRKEKSMVAEEEAETDLIARRKRLEQRLREVLTQDKMDAFKSEDDLKNFIRQTEHEFMLKEQLRGHERVKQKLIEDDELVKLADRFKFDRDREGVLRRIEIAGIENDERREQAWKDLTADERGRDELHRGDLERKLGTTRNDAERRKIELEIEHLENAEDNRQAEEGLRRLRIQQDIELDGQRGMQEVEAKRLEARNKATAESLISILGDPNQASQRIAELERLRLKQNLSPEQILAMTAEVSPAAAAALAKKYESEGLVNEKLMKNMERQLAEQKQMSEGYADRMERLMRTSLREMGDVAATRARAVDPKQTVVVPGSGFAPPVVVDAGGMPRCKHCNATLAAGEVFCGNCGKKVDA